MSSENVLAEKSDSRRYPCLVFRIRSEGKALLVYIVPTFGHMQGRDFIFCHVILTFGRKRFVVPYV